MREMKDSGIEWVGEIPASWRTIHLKYYCTFKTGGTPSNKFGINVDDDGYPWVTPSEILDTFKVAHCPQYINKDALKMFKYELFPIGSILLVCIASVGKIALLEEPSYANQQITVLQDKGNVVSKYLLYYLFACKPKMVSESSSNVVPIINAQYLSNLQCLLLPLSEQRRIAAFLDAKCNEIDALTADVQSQIDVLEQYKRSVITEAVTKGLNPDVEMKDSGIEWIGFIPKHWNVHPLYYYFNERKNKNCCGTETNLLSLSYGRIIRKDITGIGGLLPESFNGYNIIEKDDIVMRLTDLQNDKRSLRTGLSPERGIITSAYVTLKAIRKLDARYYHFLLHAYDVMKVLYNMGNGVRQSLNYSELSKMMLVGPPYDEQVRIAEYLTGFVEKINNIIDDKQKQLTVIDKYKKSLIYEYVTGKKEVPV